MKSRFPGPPGENQRRELFEVAHSPEILTLSHDNLATILELLKSNYPHEAKAADHDLLVWKEAFSRVSKVLSENKKKRQTTVSNIIQSLILIVLLLTLGYQVYKDLNAGSEPNLQSKETNKEQLADPAHATKN